MNSYGNNQKKLICYITFAIIVLVLVVNYFMHRGVRRGVKDIPEPVQTEAEGMTTVDINGYHLYILFVKSFNHFFDFFTFYPLFLLFFHLSTFLNYL